MRQLTFSRFLPRNLQFIKQALRFTSIIEIVEQNLLNDIPIENIRNFSVIAHIDHGKSTLCDAILQLTGNISEKDRKRGQVLDTLKVERERGITVKAQTASMIFDDDRTSKRYLLNLIDTPGHVDFSYEVSRSLASCQGALLLVDSTQSIQAQTLANYEKARKLNLNMIPVVTKIDLPNSQPEEVALTMAATFGLDPDAVIPTSAKQCLGIKEVLRAVIDHLPGPFEGMNATTRDGGEEVGAETRKAPICDPSGKFLGRIIDSWFDEHRGVVCLIQVMAGEVRENQRISTYASVKESKDLDARSDFSVQEVGILAPQHIRTSVLRTGQVGYLISGMRSTRQARIGDTMYLPHDWAKREDVTPLLGYEAAKPMLFASVFPVNSAEIELLYASVERLCLNDSSISVARDQSAALGSGLRCGFLGFLHMEVFNQRLKDEFNIDVIMTTPSVPYKISTSNLTPNDKAKEKYRQAEESGERVITNVALWPQPGKNQKLEVSEPMVRVVLISPQQFYGEMVRILKERRSKEIVIQHSTDGFSGGEGGGRTMIHESEEEDQGQEGEVEEEFEEVGEGDLKQKGEDDEEEDSEASSSFEFSSPSSTPSAPLLDGDVSSQVVLSALVPWQEVVCDMHNEIKNASSGYASFNYEEAGYMKADLVKVDVVVNNETCEPLSFITHVKKAQGAGRVVVERLKTVLSRQQFEIVLQAKINSKIIARERLAPYRKDVLSRSGKTVGGGDMSRKKKLLEKQKEGKKRSKMVGNVEIGQEAFWAVLQR